MLDTNTMFYAIRYTTIEHKRTLNIEHRKHSNIELIVENGQKMCPADRFKLSQNIW